MVVPSYRLKTTEPPHRRFSFSHAHYKLSAEYHRKRRLRVQDRSAGCVLSCTNTSRQQEVPSFCLQKQGISVLSTSLQSEQCPAGIYKPGTLVCSLPPLSGDFGNSVSRRSADTSSRPSIVITPPVLVTTYAEHGRPKVKRSKVQTRTSSEYPVSGASVTLRSGESFPPNIQSSVDYSTRVPYIIPEHAVIFRSVPIHGITQLGIRSHPTVSPVFEAPATTFAIARPDKPVYTTMSVSPFSSCHLTQAMAGPIFSHVRNPYPTFPGRVHGFHGRLYPGLGRPHGGFPDCGCLDPFRTRAPHHELQYYRAIML